MRLHPFQDCRKRISSIEHIVSTHKMSNQSPSPFSQTKFSSSTKIRFHSGVHADAINHGLINTHSHTPIHKKTNIFTRGLSPARVLVAINLPPFVCLCDGPASRCCLPSKIFYLFCGCFFAFLMFAGFVYPSDSVDG